MICIIRGEEIGEAWSTPPENGELKVAQEGLPRKTTGLEELICQTQKSGR